MKKMLSALVSAVFILSSCGSDESASTNSKKGDLITSVSFNGITTKAASSTAIPVTSWSNVNKIQLFLYNSTDGTVAFSDIIDPSVASDKVFKWTNIPEGTYDLALVANIKSDVDNVATSLDGGANWVRFDSYNVLNKKLNSELFIDLKKSTFPTGHTFGATDVSYASASEIFTAYASAVKIEEGKTTNLASTQGVLQLKREISLMRIRINKTDKPESAPTLSTVDFAHENNFISIENLPVGIGLKLGAFAGGIYATPSDTKRIMIGASGVDTYNDEDPTTDYDPKVIIDSRFTLWKDIRVLPNVTRVEGKATDADASRRYAIVLAGWAPAGYEYADGTKAQQAQPVYWSGTVKGAFPPNVIREVNINIESKGYPERPVLQPEGGLNIEIGFPVKWDSNIESEVIKV